jgi:hypothetical protein
MRTKRRRPFRLFREVSADLRPTMMRAACYSAFLVGVCAFSTNPTPMEYPKLIDLPMDTSPEGVVAGMGSTIFAGARSDGRIFKVDTATGEVVELVAPLPYGDPRNFGALGRWTHLRHDDQHGLLCWRALG